MRYLIILIACVACALPALATVDPDIDQIGVYFDLNADETCLEAGPFQQFSAYLIITNPSASAVHGIEVGMCADGPVQRFYANWYESCIGVDYFQGCYNYMSFGFQDPVPFVGTNVPLVRFDYWLLGDSQVEFYLRPLTEYIPSGLPEYLDASGNVYPLGISSGNPNSPVAVVNGDCSAVVSITGVTLDAVKSLYR